MNHAIQRVFGIDLGTTYSAIAYVDNRGTPVIVANRESERITPSVVLFDGDNVIVGSAAKEAAKTEPDRVVSLIKRQVSDRNYLFEQDGRTYGPAELNSFILRKLVGDAEIALGERITDVVITCPAYFGVDEREATANAGQLAGLRVRAILNEPTAAAIAYGLEQGEDQTVLVYDLGGGTFDVTLIEIKDRLIRVICTGGDYQIGGALWDEALVEHLAGAFQHEVQAETDPMDDPEVLNDLFLQAERGKKTLSLRERAGFRVTHAGREVRVEVSREQFESLTRHLLDRTIALTRELLIDAEAKGTTGFDKIILVGGATRMPQIVERLRAEFGIEAESYDPDEAVAKGAALYGLRETLQAEVSAVLAPETVDDGDESFDGDGSRDRSRIRAAEVIEAASPEEVSEALDSIERAIGFTLTGPVRELVQTRIINVLSKSLGVIARDEAGAAVVVYLLARNSEVPLEHAVDFGTDQEDQTGVEIKVVAGERDSPEPEDCQEVGLVLLDLPDGRPARSPIRVTFAIDHDGRLGVSAVDLTGGASIHVEFETETVMSAEVVEERARALQMRHVS